MGKLFDKATQQDSLTIAWQRIRANGQNSVLPETREAVSEFARKADYDIRRIQRALRDKTFDFKPQKGVLKEKSGGRFRGIVMAPIENRIVERALLDRLQSDIPFVRHVIETPTCIGGVPYRSVPHGLAQIVEAFESKKKYFVRSDISSFFDGIPRHTVLEKLRAHIDDTSFLTLLEKATTVTLANEKQLGENKRIFPTNEEGVAQGSPLSPLFGNVLLSDFDQQFNERGIICIRFIDDFLLLGEKEENVKKAFVNARVHLQKLGLACHDPFVIGASSAKSQCGNVDNGFVFLGYDIRPGLIQPSSDARKDLIRKIGSHIHRGKKEIIAALAGERLGENTQRYIQTLRLIDNVIRGWGNAFAYGNAPNTLNDLDKSIDQIIDDFRYWFANKIKAVDPSAKRRAGGVCLLTDIEPKSLKELPYRLEKKTFRHSKKTIDIYTDGSLLRDSPFSKEKTGFGGWSVVLPDGKTLSGAETNVTNNQMELKAVVEALRATPPKSSVQIRTDSNYVVRAAEERTVIKKNHALWAEFDKLRNARRVKLIWIKGHNDNPRNELADQLANKAATELVAKLGLKTSRKS